jgi:predicted SAM-dependent methyltransferase
MKPLCLNLGANNIRIQDFVNIDIDSNMRPDLCIDVFDLPKFFGPDSVDYIYMGHFLEHFSVDEGKEITKLCFNALKSYGTLMAVCPDYTKLDGLNIQEKERIIFGANDHKVLIDIERLRSYFNLAGFGTIICPDISDLRHTPYPYVRWQTACMGIKHSKIYFS